MVLRLKRRNSLSGGILEDLKGRVVVITGGNGGIGLGLAEGVARAGANVIIMGRNRNKLDSALRRLAEVGGGEVEAIEVDVAKEGSVVEAFALAKDLFGRVDSVFANAGISASLSSFVDTSVEEWDKVLKVNLLGAVLCLREAAKIMISQGEGGSLVAVSSVSAILGAAGIIPYAASKTAMLAVVRALAVELSPQRIRVNAILPGWVETEMTAPLMGNQKFLSSTTERFPAKRWGRPEDFQQIAAYLADPTNIHHTGDSMVVDGGYTLG